MHIRGVNHFTKAGPLAPAPFLLIETGKTTKQALCFVSFRSLEHTYIYLSKYLVGGHGWILYLAWHLRLPFFCFTLLRFPS